MILLSLKLLIAHLLGDFVFQPDKWVKHKKKNLYKSKFLYIHIGIHLISLLLLLQFNLKYWIGILVIIISHYIIDILKLKFETIKNKRSIFFLDQLAHILIIICVISSYSTFKIDLDLLYSPKNLMLVFALLSVTFVSSIFMRVLMSKWRLDDYNQDSLDKAGMYIGILERLFVFIFIILNQWASIGFLITAKSVFRFGDLTKAKNLKLTEYVLIGTLLSYGLAIITGLFYLWGMENLKL